MAMKETEIKTKVKADQQFFRQLLADVDTTLKGSDPGVIAKVKDVLASRPELSKWRLKADLADVEW